VAGGDVGGGDGGVVHLHGAAFDGDVGRLAVHGGGGVELDHVGGLHLPGHHVVGQDGDELVLVLGLEQVLERAGRQLREGLVGGREHGERALAAERLDQAGGLDRGDQGFEVRVAGGDVDDGAGRLGLVVVVGERRGGDGGGQHQGEQGLAQQGHGVLLG